MSESIARSYPPDPGGNFASDVHRRVVTAVPNQEQQGEEATVGKDASGHKVRGPAKSLDAIVYYVQQDEDAPINSEEEVRQVLAELVEDGDVQELKDGYKLTKQGEEVAAGDNADNGGRRYYSDEE